MVLTSACKLVCVYFGKTPYSFIYIQFKSWSNLNYLERSKFPFSTLNKVSNPDLNVYNKS